MTAVIFHSQIKIIHPLNMARAKAEAIINPTSGDATFMKEIIMGYQGEMSLKGLNRNQFEAAMMKILRDRLKTVG